MQSRRKTYIYVGTLALAVVGFLVDRALQSGPQDAAAREVQPKAHDKPPQTPLAARATQQNTADSGTPAPSPDSASRWLRELPEVTEVRDPFASTNLFPPDAEATAEEAGGKARDPIADFITTHRLSATFRDDRSACAVVDGRVLRPGQQLDGFRLITVDPFRATFRQGNRQAVLPMLTAEQAEENNAAETR